MENDENTDVLDVETQDEQFEEDNSVDTTVETDDSTSDDTTEEDELAKAKAEAAKFRRLYEKSQKKQEAVKPNARTESSPSVDIDERILKANGVPDQLLSELKVIAKVRGVSIIDAQTDPLFVATKEKFEREQKSKQASMGASRGSSSPKPKVSLETPGISRDEHMKLAKEEMR